MKLTSIDHLNCNQKEVENIKKDFSAAKISDKQQ